MSRTFHLNGGYRILSALILVFIISWTPYNILSILKVILRVNQSSTVKENLLVKIYNKDTKTNYYTGYPTRPLGHSLRSNVHQLHY